MYIWYNVWSISEVSLLIFCLDDLSLGDSGAFRSPTITVLAFICVLRALDIFLINGCPCGLCRYVKDLFPFDELFLSLI
jgi:hypothetical protein